MASKTMAELLAKTGSQIRGFSRGQKINAKLLSVSPKIAIFNVGGKSEGILIDDYFDEARDFLRTLKVGDEVTATVMDPETSDGAVLLSLRHAASGQLWDKLEDVKKKNVEITAVGRNATPAGLLVEIESISAFIPSSQLSRSASVDPSALVGKHFKVKVIEIDKDKRKIVASEKAVTEAQDIKDTGEALSKIKDGRIYSGGVTTVADFGIFVKIKVGKASVEGLVHVSELSWDRKADPAKLFKIGDIVKVKAIGLRDGKLALSIKKAVEDPWTKAGDKYKADDKVKGTVVRSSDFGSFVELEPGIEGLIHITKIPPAQKLSMGDKVNCYIEEIDVKNKKISLGLVLTSKPVGYK